MLARLAVAFAVFVMLAGNAEARRVALVIGQNAYPGGKSATVGLPGLNNSVLDARAMAALLAKHGFDVMSCGGHEAGCFDLNREGFSAALAQLRDQANGADLALVYFAGHGVATPEGNILAPTDARVKCETGAVTFGVSVERILEAVRPARDKLVLLDACRDNPLGAICPNLKGKTLSFTRIEAGAMQGLLLVTSTQFGQQALDGAVGAHSPFAASLLTALEANPSIYFEQVMNEVARATFDAAHKLRSDFDQIPGKVVGGAAPADCLAGKDCAGDPRMAALSIENERLAADAAGVRNLLSEEETARGKPYTAEERGQRMAQLQATLASIGKSTDPLRQEGRRLIESGKVDDGTAKLDQALDADEKAIAEAERIATERRKAGAQAARDLGVLASGRDAVKAMAYYRRATALDPEDARTWDDYGRAAMEVGRLAEAKTAFAKAVSAAQTANDTYQEYWATLGLGDVAMAAGSLPEARHAYDAASAIAERLAKEDPGSADGQRNLSVSHGKIGDVLVAQGDLPEALAAYRASRDIFDRLATADPGNADGQRDLSVSHNKVGEVLIAQGNLPEALAAYRASLTIRERLAKADPNDASWQGDLSVSHEKIGDVLVAQGNLPEALAAYRASLAIRERLAKADLGNAVWQRGLSVSHIKVGDMLVAQGDLAQALAAYRTAHDIFDRLAKTDPGNAGWQRQLSVSHEKIGNALVSQGNLPEALAAYQTALAIRERLAKADPGNAGWQRDLAVSHMKAGEVLAAQGNLPEALAAYRASLAVAERLAKVDPSNAGWQRDLSVSHLKVGDALAAQGNLPATLAAYRASHDIFDRLAKADPGNVGWQRDLAVSHERIGDVLVDQGNLPEALAAHRASLAIAERLAQEDPSNAGWQRDLAISHGRVGRVLARQGQDKLAQSAFREGRAIIVTLNAHSPDNATLAEDLAWFDELLAGKGL